MKISVLRTVFAATLATLLAACGSGVDAELPIQTAAMTGTATMSGGGAQVAANAPAPDCAPEGCSGLRIIDANAEAYRYEAMRRAAAEPQT